MIKNENFLLKHIINISILSYIHDSHCAKKTGNILLYYKCTCVYTNFSSSDDEDSQHSTPYNQEQVDKEKFARYVSIEYTLQSRTSGQGKIC